MKIAFVGKGGCGKTTLTSLFTRHLAACGLPVLAIDADINQHLGVALGLDDEQAADLPAMGSHLDEIKDYLRGDNPRIRSAAAMVKTTPPGTGSRLVRVVERNPIYDQLSRAVGGVRLLVTGPFTEQDLGVACYHAKVGAVELLLNHLVDGPGEYVVVDMTAGVDAFASGLFTRFDLVILVCEPTRRGVGVYRQFRQHADGHGVALHVVGNKVTDHGDLAWLGAELGAAPLAALGHSAWVRAAEQGHPPAFAALEPEVRHALDAVLTALDGMRRDWAAYHRDTVHFHLRNAAAWANRAVGRDLAEQVDPDFVPGPTITAACS